ncbi:MAG: hypothetical protein SOY04_12615 [Clostridium celatum]|nr:hypothetical protein [Clostridium celatum]
MKNKLMEKWGNIFENEKEFCSGELAEELNIYVYEIEMDKYKIHGNELKSFYISKYNRYHIYINSKLDSGTIYDEIKALFFRIIDKKLQREYFFL